MTQQPDLDALVVRNIGDILAAMDHADTMLPRLWRESGAVVRAVTRADWISVCNPQEEEVWTAKRDWLVSDAEPTDADFFLGLDERTVTGGDGEQSWLATFTGTGPQGATLALWLDQKILNPNPWKKLLKTHENLVNTLVDAGFQYDANDDRRLCVPVLIDTEELAKAFENDDFGAALQPIADAVETAERSSESLSQLRDVARADAT